MHLALAEQIEPPRKRERLMDRVLARLQQTPNVWVDARELADVGGFAAWRTRVSNLRKHGYQIENQWYDVRQRDGRTFRVSLYKLVTH